MDIWRWADRSVAEVLLGFYWPSFRCSVAAWNGTILGTGAEPGKRMMIDGANVDRAGRATVPLGIGGDQDHCRGMTSARDRIGGEPFPIIGRTKLSTRRWPRGSAEQVHHQARLVGTD